MRFVCVRAVLICKCPNSAFKNNQYRCTAWKLVLKHPESNMWSGLEKAAACLLRGFAEVRC